MFERHWSLVALVVGGLGLAAISGCNTVSGAGEDIESAGEAISETADDAAEEINE